MWLLETIADPGSHDPRLRQHCLDPRSARLASATISRNSLASSAVAPLNKSDSIREFSSAFSK